MTDTKGKVVGVNGNMVSVEFDGNISMNEVAYVKVEGSSLKSEVIRIRGNTAQMQVYEMTKGIQCGDEVEFTGDLLSAELGPGLLGQVYDGLQNPLPLLAEKAGWFLERGIYVNPLDRSKKWHFTPVSKTGDSVKAGEYVGSVPEGPFTHKIFVPFYLLGTYTVKSIVSEGDYTLDDTIAVLDDGKGNEVKVTMSFRWPVKRAVGCYAERLAPAETMVTKVRLIDTFFPVAKGGTYCIPGPFGAGKTVLQHTTSKYADVDIVIIAACGERAGEVVETLTEFPELKDPKTGKSLMERTIIICLRNGNALYGELLDHGLRSYDNGLAGHSLLHKDSGNNHQGQGVQPGIKVPGNFNVQDSYQKHPAVYDLRHSYASCDRDPVLHLLRGIPRLHRHGP